MFSTPRRRGGILGLAGTTAAAAISYFFFNADPINTDQFKRSMPDDGNQMLPPPTLLHTITRAQQIQATKEKNFDLLIIGGGATGAGCALDAATRGLSVCLIERDDFASGTSSRSTKLVHGGVRYLEKAFWERDYEQYKLVVEALYERSVFLKIAPYLSYQLPIMLPIYKFWKVPYYWAGSKAYDILAGKEGLSPSYFLSKRKALEAFPMLKNGGLVGAMVYYDGAHNDARMNVALVLTAIAQGATAANHVEVMKLIKKERTALLGKFNFGAEEICGAIVRDEFTHEEWTVKAKGVINATGPFCDSIRRLDDASISTIVAPAAGTHIILPGFYSPRTMGLLDPQTSDGRVIFFLPWEGNTIAGTTDTPTEVTSNPVATEIEIEWILKEVENYLRDVLAAWSGIRPLVRDPSAKNTAALVRNHMINVSPTGLLTIAGGKWTTYRAMAKDAIDEAVRIFQLNPTAPICKTEQIQLIGTQHWHANMFVKLIQHFGLETEVAQHLSNSYGDQAWNVAALASPSGSRWPVFGRRLVSYYPYIDAEVRYACQKEYACTAVDVLARRTRLAFLNAYAALDALPMVIDIMAEELGWDAERRKSEFDTTVIFLKTMGLRASSSDDPSLVKSGDIEVSPTNNLVTFFTRNNFLPHELLKFRKEFSAVDQGDSGYISKSDFEHILANLGIEVNPTEIAHVFEKSRSGNEEAHDRIAFSDYLEVLAVTKEVKSRQKFSAVVAHSIEVDEDREVIDTDRSGGGV